MKKIISAALLLLLIYALAACAPYKKTETPPSDVSKKIAQKGDPATVCVNQNGKWIAEYAECEGLSKESCDENGGNFNECASACRHDPNAQICTMQCVLVCEFGKSDDTKKPQIIGGDKDEHGCLGPAGYSWCEEKQKCLRTWEEPCSQGSQELSDEIKQLFIEKYKKPSDEIAVIVTKSDDSHAKGDVKFGKNGIGEGGLYWAAKEEGVWKLVFDGNGIIPCSVLEPYNFPVDMTEGCFKQ